MKIKELGLTKLDIIEANCMHTHTVTNMTGITTCKDCGHKFNSDEKSYQEIEDAVKTVIDAIETAKLAIGNSESVNFSMIDRVQQIACAIPMIEKLPNVYTAAIETLNDAAEAACNNRRVSPLTQDDIKMLHENKGMES